MTNPVMAALVAARLSEETRRMEAMNADLEPPRSWPNEFKNRFKQITARCSSLHRRRMSSRRDLEVAAVTTNWRKPDRQCTDCEKSHKENQGWH